MSSVTSEWLALRESSDRKARNSEIANALAARFALRSTVRVVDLGCGIGANLRAVAPLLPDVQSWVLADTDPETIAAARDTLCAWADAWRNDGDTLVLDKGRAQLRVTLQFVDLGQDFEQLFAEAPDLVTGGAFFNLLPEASIKRLAKLCADSKAAFYAAMTRNGVQRWMPHRPLDSSMAAALQKHQLADWGFGPASGPLAPALLADYFRIHDYAVLEGDSTWRLGSGDRMLLAELVRMSAFAAEESGDIDSRTIEAWVKVPRTGAEIGHVDVFAAPG